MAPIPKPSPSPTPASDGPAPAATAHPNFPLSALGPILSAAATAAAAHTQAPVELVAHHLLCLAAMPAQRLISVRLPTGRVQPVSSYFLSLVGSGEGRSAAESLCVAPVRFWEKRFTAAAGVIDEKGRRLEHSTITIDSRWDESEPETEENVTRIHALLPSSDPPVSKPSKPFEFDQVFLSPFRSGINDRYDRYARFGRRSGLFARVAADLVTPSCARRNEADSLAALWDGRVLVTGVESAALAPRLSAHLVATPGEGLALLRAPELAQSGLLGRLLTVMPPSRIGQRIYREGDGAAPPAVRALHALLTELYAREATDEARIVTLGASAKDAWLSFAAETEAAMAPDGAFAAIRPLAGHLAEHALRLAAIIALLGDGALAELSLGDLERGLALARFYAEEALRIHDLAAPRLTESEKEELLREWLQRTQVEKDVKLRDVCRLGPSPLRDSDTAYKLMRRLERLGIVQPKSDSVGGGGAGAPRRRGARYEWRVEREASQSVA